MPWYFAIAERDHELQNPTTAEKLRLLGERLRLGPGKHVLDLGSGRGGPALLLAEAFGCRVTAVERSEEFHLAARERARARGLESLVELVHADAREFPLEEEAYDVVMCLGASFVWDGLEPTLAALSPVARRGGHVCVGEPYWRRWPLPDEIDDEGYTTLAGTVERFERAGLPVVTIVAASEDDWDRYVTLSWRALEEWLAEHDDEEIRRQYEDWKAEYLRWQRELLGWAIFAGWKRDHVAIRRNAGLGAAGLAAPITHELSLRCAADVAFAAYVERIGEWWDPRYTASPATLEAVTIEPRVGGRVYATHGDLGEDDWGELTAWEPGRRLVHTFTLAQDPRHASEVAVEFVPREGGCTLRFAHGGWTAENVAVREKFSDWPVMLDRFAALAHASGGE